MEREGKKRFKKGEMPQARAYNKKRNVRFDQREKNTVLYTEPSNNNKTTSPHQVHSTMPSKLKLYNSHSIRLDRGLEPSATPHAHSHPHPQGYHSPTNENV